jgi:alpha-galactosidase/6-phospho-beta-glucosidase family protein
MPCPGHAMACPCPQTAVPARAGKMRLGKSVKIVIIGAGSTVFTPGLIADLTGSKQLSDITVALVDINAQAAETMARYAERVARERGVSLRVEYASDRREVLAGADFVTVTIAVGGVRGWERDVRIPEAHGVWQTVGDSVGPGGVFRALRHVPELVAIAKDMEELCPDAWLFNYTNPLTPLVRAVQKMSPIKCAGLCHGILGTREDIAYALGIPHLELSLTAAGLNHLCWVLDLRHDGQDVYPRFRELVGGWLISPPPPSDDPYEGFQEVSARLMEIYGFYPSPGDRHVAEFFPFFLRKSGDGLAYGTQPGLDMTNRILASRDERWDRITAQAESRAELDRRLFAESREGERVVSIIEAIVIDKPLLELAVNVRNDGLIPNLPREAVVEVPGLIDGRGVHGVAVGPLPEGIANILGARARQQELMVDAALSGDRTLALQALLADPLVPSVEAAEGMLEDALAAHAAFLPRFAGSVAASVA